MEQSAKAYANDACMFPTIDYDSKQIYFENNLKITSTNVTGP